MKRITIGRLLATLGLFFVLAQTAVAGDIKDQQVDTPKSRAFRLDYGATLDKLPTDSRVRVWLPVPQTNEHQTVKVLKSHLPVNGKTSMWW